MLMFCQQLVSIRLVEELIFGNRITMCDVAFNSGIIVGIVETIIPIGPKDVNFRQEGAACCCVC
jgi:hypothetical protein